MQFSRLFKASSSHASSKQCIGKEKLWLDLTLLTISLLIFIFLVSPCVMRFQLSSPCSKKHLFIISLSSWLFSFSWIVECCHLFKISRLLSVLSIELNFPSKYKTTGIAFSIAQAQSNRCTISFGFLCPRDFRSWLSITRLLLP